MTAPGNFTAGDVLQASDLNAGSPSCLLESSTQSIPNSTTTRLYFSTELHDPLGWHSTTTNTERITPTIAGLYLVTASTFDITSGVAGRLFFAILKNSTGQVRFDTTATLHYGVTTTGVVEMNGTTDYLFVEVYQTSGSAKSFNTNRFSVTRIAG